MALAKRTRRQPALTRAVAELFPAQGEWTEEEYLALPDTNRIIELSDGKVEVVEMPTDPHQLTVVRLVYFVMAFLTTRKLGRLRTAPLRVRLWPGKFREPDLVFMSAEHANRIGVEYWGVPDLVVEVHSPGTRRLDRVIKKREYARAGIPEYWMADYEAKEIEVYRLQEEAYQVSGSFAVGDTLNSGQLPGFELKIADVFGEE